MKPISLAIFGFIFLTASSALAGDELTFEGCKGTAVARANGKAPSDVAQDLVRAQRRMKQICEKELVGPQAELKKNVDACVDGASEELKKNPSRSYLPAYQKRLDEDAKYACRTVRQTLVDANDFCRVRKSTLAQVEKGLAASKNIDATKFHGLAAEMNKSGEKAYRFLSTEAGEAKDRIYRRLPDEDEDRDLEAKESASSNDPIVEDAVKTGDEKAAILAEGNKNPAACMALTGKKSSFAKYGAKLNNNLWPIGKVSARAMAAMEQEDLERAEALAGNAEENSARDQDLDSVESRDDTARSSFNEEVDPESVENDREYRAKEYEREQKKEQDIKTTLEKNGLPDTPDGREEAKNILAAESKQRHLDIKKIVEEEELPKNVVGYTKAKKIYEARQATAAVDSSASEDLAPVKVNTRNVLPEEKESSGAVLSAIREARETKQVVPAAENKVYPSDYPSSYESQTANPVPASYSQAGKVCVLSAAWFGSNSYGVTDSSGQCVGSTNLQPCVFKTYSMWFDEMGVLDSNGQCVGG